jgi:transposase
LLRVHQVDYQGVSASEKEPEAWSATDKFTVVLETAGLNDTELGASCRERGLFPESVSHWRQAATDAYAAPVLMTWAAAYSDATTLNG